MSNLVFIRLMFCLVLHPVNYRYNMSMLQLFFRREKASARPFYPTLKISTAI